MSAAGGVFAGLAEETASWKRFLASTSIGTIAVLRMTNKARRIIGDLFGAFMADPSPAAPQYQRRRISRVGGRLHIAGMTDRYAMKEHRRLFAVGEI